MRQSELGLVNVIGYLKDILIRIVVHQSHITHTQGIVDVMDIVLDVLVDFAQSFQAFLLAMYGIYHLRNITSGNIEAVTLAVDNVKAGYSVFIMPEGTRNHEEEMLPFKEGSFKVAEKAQCPIVPIAFSNTDALYELHKPWVKKAKVVVHFGDPIPTTDLSREDKKALAGKVQGIIADMLKEDKALIS